MHSWPLFDLRLITPRLTLRLPTDEDLDRLATGSAGRVLPPDEANFMDSDWTQLSSPEYERSFVQFHWHARADWKPESWNLQLVGFDGDAPIGGFGLIGENLAESRTVKTGSWLLPDWRRMGLGSEARAALLQLAFAELGAQEARTEAHPANAGSLGVSRALGYEETGRRELTRPAGDAAPRVQMCLTREKWEATRTTAVEVVGIDGCRELFGVTDF